MIKVERGVVSIAMPSDIEYGPLKTQAVQVSFQFTTLNLLIEPENYDLDTYRPIPFNDLTMSLGHRGEGSQK